MHGDYWKLWQKIILAFRSKFNFKYPRKRNIFIKDQKCCVSFFLCLEFVLILFLINLLLLHEYELVKKQILVLFKMGHVSRLPFVLWVPIYADDD